MPKVRFEPDGIEVEVPVGTSILDAARRCGAQVGSACGGVCACSTCHVYIREGAAALPAPSDREEDIMDKAFDVRPSSRLGCQSKVLKDVTVIAEISPESRKAFLDEHPELRGR
jgi:ferredoxin, 2Fe-2S